MSSGRKPPEFHVRTDDGITAEAGKKPFLRFELENRQKVRRRRSQFFRLGPRPILKAHSGLLSLLP